MQNKRYKMECNKFGIWIILDMHKGCGQGQVVYFPYDENGIAHMGTSSYKEAKEYCDQLNAQEEENG